MTTLVRELQQRRGELQREIERDSGKVQELTASITRKKRAVDAIEELLRVETGQETGEASVTPFPLSRSRGYVDPVSDAARDVLFQRGEPVHYLELAREIQLRGVALGGKNPANTMLAHLVRDPRFYRPGRGTYALREWAPGAPNVGAHRRKRGA